MTLYDLGFNAISPPSESAVIPEDKMLNYISRFKYIVSFYDNDATGIKYGKKFKYNIFLPINSSKDAWDFKIKYNGKNLKKFVKNQLNKIKIQRTN